MNKYYIVKDQNIWEIIELENGRSEGASGYYKRLKVNAQAQAVINEVFPCTVVLEQALTEQSAFYEDVVVTDADGFVYQQTTEELPVKITINDATYNVVTGQEFDLCFTSAGKYKIKATNDIMHAELEVTVQ